MNAVDFAFFLIEIVGTVAFAKAPEVSAKSSALKIYVLLPEFVVTISPRRTAAKSCVSPPKSKFVLSM